MRLGGEFGGMDRDVNVRIPSHSLATWLCKHCPAIRQDALSSQSLTSYLMHVPCILIIFLQHGPVTFVHAWHSFIGTYVHAGGTHKSRFYLFLHPPSTLIISIGLCTFFPLFLFLNKLLRVSLYLVFLLCGKQWCIINNSEDLQLPYFPFWSECPCISRLYDGIGGWDKAMNLRRNVLEGNICVIHCRCKQGREKRQQVFCWAVAALNDRMLGTESGASPLIYPFQPWNLDCNGRTL